MRETFVLNLRDAARGCLRLAGLRREACDEHTLEVEVTLEQNLNELFAALSARGIQVLSACATRPTGSRNSS